MKKIDYPFSIVQVIHNHLFQGYVLLLELGEVLDLLLVVLVAEHLGILAVQLVHFLLHGLVPVLEDLLLQLILLQEFLRKGTIERCRNRKFGRQ